MIEIRGVNGIGEEDRTYFRLPDDAEWYPGEWVVLYDVHIDKGNVFEHDGCRYSDAVGGDVQYLLNQIEHHRKQARQWAAVAVAPHGSWLSL